MAKKFVVRFIAISLSLLLLTAAAVAVIDPLYQYHLPWFGLDMALFSERYQNAGLARQLDYNAVIVGSSMMKNNRARWFDEAFGCKALKLSFSSGYLTEYDVMLESIYRHQTLDYVFLSLDAYALSADSGYQMYPCPPYLYDSNRLNDVGYLLNRDVLLDVLPQFFEGQGSAVAFEDAFSFAEQMHFGRALVLPRYLAWRNAAAPAGSPLPRDAYRATCQESLTHMTRHIAAHPETTFYVFLPPYSVMMWDRYILEGKAEATLGAVDEAARILLAYDNVRFFCFLGMEEVTADLDNYGDEMHFDRPVSERLVTCMRSGAYEVTRENRAAFMTALDEFILHYDYEAAFAGADVVQ